MVTKKSKQQEQEKAELSNLGKMLQNIYDSGYLDRNTTYKMSFLKGVAAGFGGVIGATIVVALLIWILSLFDSFPLVGPIIDNFQETVDKKTAP
jgi:hypothetical protein